MSKRTTIERSTAVFALEQEIQNWTKKMALLKRATLNTACAGCTQPLTLICGHCLRGNAVKDFYKPEETN